MAKSIQQILKRHALLGAHPPTLSKLLINLKPLPKLGIGIQPPLNGVANERHNDSGHESDDNTKWEGLELMPALNSKKSNFDRKVALTAITYWSICCGGQKL